MATRVRINYAYLLIGLLLLVLVNPMADQFIENRTFKRLSDYTGLILLIGVWSLGSNRVWFRIGCILAVFAVAVTAASVAFGLSALLDLGRLLLLIFCAMTAWIALQDVFRPKAPVTDNQLMSTFLGSSFTSSTAPAASDVV